MALPESIELRKLRRTAGGEYDGQSLVTYWALYCGGRALFGDPGILAQVFPSHDGEREATYAKRVARAYYLNRVGHIVNDHSMELFTDPLNVEVTGAGAAYFREWLRDTSPAGGDEVPWTELLGQQVVHLMVSARAWTRLYRRDISGLLSGLDRAPTMGELDAVGGRDIYARIVPPGQIVDWKYDGEQLKWLSRHYTAAERGAWQDDEKVWHVWEVWTRDSYAEYACAPRELEGDERTQIKARALGPNPYGRVPFVGCSVPEGLWLVDQVAKVAIESFNKRCALSWAQYKNLFAPRTYFLNDTKPAVEGGGQVGTDPSQLGRQPVGPGYGEALKSGEDVKYVGQPTDAFDHVRAQIAELEVDISRVLHAIDLAANVTAGPAHRTAESRRLDHAVSRPFLTFLGARARQHTKQVLETMAEMRGDTGVTFAVSGLEEFDPDPTSAVIEQAVKVEGIEVPSKTFQMRWKAKIARAALGSDADERAREEIDRELEEFYAHQYDMDEPGPLPPPSADDDEYEGEEDDEHAQ